MLRNYLRIAWRNLIRNKSFSVINILGLALGMTCSLLIFLWVQDEYSVDGFHSNDKQVFHVYEKHYNNGEIDASYLTQGLLGTELKKRFPEIEFASTLEQNAPYPYTIEANNKVFKFNGSYATADFFRMFSYHLLNGNPESALSSTGGIAISRNMAEKFYGSADDAMGKPMRFENRENLLITAVFENLPGKSSVQFDFMRNWEDYAQQNAWVNTWGSFSPYTFLQLRKDVDPEKFAGKIKDFVHLFTPKTNDSYTELAIQPYREKYLHSNFDNGQLSGGRIEYVRLFSLIAVFILLVACINFMNLATARSTKRAKEVGIRKVVGAARFALIGQFIGEAILLTFFSIIVALVLTDLILPAFNYLTGKQLYLPYQEFNFWIALLILVSFTGLIAGSYPAIFLSSFNPHKVLKGIVKNGGGGRFFRRSLVVFQFTLSIILIVGMIVIYRQIQYTQSRNLGYDRENLIYIPIEGELINSYDVFKEKALQIPGIQLVSKMRENPTVIGHHTGNVSWPGKDPNLVTSFADATVGYDFVKTMKLQLVDGRDFSKEFGIDSAAYLLNEAAVDKIGFRDPVGKTVSWAGKQGIVIGVIKDFHFNSLHQAIEPLIVRISEKHNWGTILVRTTAGKTSEVISGLEKLCKNMNPAFPFSYQFSDQEYTKLYKNEQLIGKLSNYFAFLAIFISCLGLFGLAMSTTEQRTKEIGVRKALGASVPNIVRMLSASFLKPIFIAMCIGFPLSWYVMNNWLQDFAYKVEIEWWVFALAGLFTTLIALLTVSYQSIKAAIANPVDSLRTE